MEYMQEIIAKNPEIKQLTEEDLQMRLELLKEKFNIRDNKDYVFPKIPGFTATGDYKTDFVNFQLAKHELYKKDPETYRKLTTITNSREKAAQEQRRKKEKRK